MERKETDIGLICSSLHCSRNELSKLSDKSFESVLNIITRPILPLTKKEKSFGIELALKIKGS